MDPDSDPGGPKTYGSDGSPTLVLTYIVLTVVRLVNFFRYSISLLIAKIEVKMKFHSWKGLIWKQNEQY